MEKCWLIAALGCSALTTIAIAEQQESQSQTAMQAYQSCINAETGKQADHNGGKIINAQAVMDACGDQRQALFDVLDSTVAAQLIGQIERHLKDREITDQ